ncbi:MAG TPA: aminotransferase class IV [Polyangiales bacterium]|nr:aminotransferase class IV [Polyangiales bacterium]
MALEQDGWVSVDGVLTPAAQARVSVFDRGFLYGDSAFEVMRTYGRRPFRERDHLERLRGSCERLLLPIASTPAEWSAEVRRTIDASGLPECNVRVMITRGVGPLGLDLSEARQPSLLCFALPLHPYPEAIYEQGVAVGLSHAARATDGTRAVGAKTSNYLGSVLALHEVKSRGCHEAIIVGPLGEIVEGATSNVFCVKGAELITPPIEAGILAGITRKTVLELAAELGIRVHEVQVHPHDLYHADEVFITSTIREIVPVVKVDDVVVASGKPGPATRRLLAAYRDKARALADSQSPQL